MIEAKGNVLEAIQTRVILGTLYINTIFENIKPTRPVKYNLTIKRLTGLHVSGTVHVETGDIVTNDLNMKANLAGSVKFTSVQVDSLKITDASGQEIRYEPQGGDIDLPTQESPKAEVWPVKFSKGFAPPLHITYSNRYTFPAPSQETVRFEFDAGPNPKEGQVWQLNKEIQLAGHTFTLGSISVEGIAEKQGYSFEFISSDSAISIFNVGIVGHAPTGGGGSRNFGSGNQRASWSASLIYDELPKGKLELVFSDLWIYGETKGWILEWQP